MSPADMSRLLDEGFANQAHLGETQALLAVRSGDVALERYGPGVDADTRLLSWSVAKSVTHALVGLLVGDGLVDVTNAAPVPSWRSDGRAEITWDHLMHMTDGLDFCEDYVDDRVSDVIDMLFGSGQEDVAGYAMARPLAHTPGTVWSYSSGTTNIMSWLAGQAVGGEEGVRAVLRNRLFGPLGMSSAEPRFDGTGTFVGSTFLYATARDFARFGELYLGGGRWRGDAVLPEGWVEHARTVAPGSEGTYGAHWWLRPDKPGWLEAHGYEGQRIVIVPEGDLVLVRLGKSPAPLSDHVGPWLDAVIERLLED